jgi:hypothetical protein
MRSIERFGVGHWLSLAVLASAGCGGSAVEGEEATVSVVQALEGDPGAVLVPEYSPFPSAPIELFEAIPYVKEAYPVIKFVYDWVTKAPVLADLIEQAKLTIVNEIRRQTVLDVEGTMVGLINRYTVIARNPTNELTRDMYASWLGDSYQTMGLMQVRIESGDIRTAHALMIPYNMLVAMHLTMLKGSGEIGVMPFDAQSSLDLLRSIKQTNYDFIGHRNTFFGNYMQFAVDTKEDSKLWRSDMFATANNAGKCNIEVTPVNAAGYPATFGGTPLPTICSMYCDLVTQVCNATGGFQQCPDLLPTENNACLHAKRAQVSARFEADIVVNGVRAAMAEIIATYPDPITSAVRPDLGPVHLAAPTFRAEDAPISASSIGSRVDVTYRDTSQQMRHISFVDNQPGAQGGVSQNYMLGIPAARAMGTDRFWSFYAGRAAAPNWLTMFDPSPGHYYEKVGANAVATGWQGTPPVSPQSLDGLIVDSPAVTPTNAAYVVVNGTDRAPYFNYFNGSAWSGWNYQAGALLQATPAAVSRGANALDYFGVGMDGLLKYGFADQWGYGLENLDGNFGGLAATTWSSDRLDVFGVGADRAIWHRYYASGSGWTEWRSLGGVFTSKPAVASWAPGRLDVFGRGTDGALWHTWCDGVNCNNNAWAGWEYMGGYILGNPVAIAPGWGKLDVFVRGGSNGLYRKRFDGGWWPNLTGYDMIASNVDTPAFTGLYRLEQVISGACLDIHDASVDSGADVQVFSCNGTGAQAFELQSLGSSLYRLVNVNSKKCLDVAGGVSWEGASIQQYTCHGGANQAFSLQGMGNGFRIVSANGLTIETGANGNVQLGEYKVVAPPQFGLPNPNGQEPVKTQLWRLVRI